MISSHLHRRLLKQRRASVTSIILALMISICPYLAAEYAVTAVRQAVFDGALLQYGSATYILDSATPQALELVRARPGAMGVGSAPSELHLDSGLYQVTAFQSSGSEALPGLIVAGGRPTSSDQILVSEGLADDAGLSIGSRVEVASATGVLRTVNVSGISVNTASRSSLYIGELLPITSSSFHSFAFVDDYENSTEIDKLSNAGQLKYASVGNIAEMALQQSDIFRRTSYVRYIALAYLALSSAVIAAVVTASYRRESKTILALKAAGLRDDQVRSLYTRSLGLVLVVGLTASALMLAISHVFVHSASKLVDQVWTSSLPPGGAMLLAVLIALLAATVPFWSIRARRLIIRPQRPRKQPPLPALLATAFFATLLTLGLVLNFSYGTLIFLIGGLAATCYFAVRIYVLRRLPRTLALTVNSTSRPLTVYVACGLLLPFSICSMAGFTSIQAALNASFGERPQPPGSLAAQGVLVPAANDLVSKYEALGGRGKPLVLVQPNEAVFQVRVTSPSLVKCYQERGGRPDDQLADCGPERTLSPINTIALTGDSGAKTEVDPNLIQDGSAGFLVYDTDSGNVVKSFTAPASPNRDLGNNLPGAFLSPASFASEGLSLEPTSSATLLLPEVQLLRASEVASLRQEIKDESPASEVIESPAASTAGSSNAPVTLALSGLTFLISLGLAGMLTVATSSMRLVYRDLAAPPRTMRLVAAALMLPSLASWLVLVLALFVTVLDLGSYLLSPGIPWIAPLLTGIIPFIGISAYWGLGRELGGLNKLTLAPNRSLNRPHRAA